MTPVLSLFAVEVYPKRDPPMQVDRVQQMAEVHEARSLAVPDPDSFIAVCLVGDILQGPSFK